MEYLANILGSIHLIILPAYIDAGTGSMLIQVLIGILAGGLVMLKIFWKKITSRFKGNSKQQLEKEQENVVDK